MAKVLQQSHGGYAGKSIIELLEDELITACCEYIRVREEDIGEEGFDHAGWEDRGKRIGTARGKVRGLAVSVAMMRHPLRRHELVWWNYVKKLENRSMKKAREMMPDF